MYELFSNRNALKGVARTLNQSGIAREMRITDTRFEVASGHTAKATVSLESTYRGWRRQTAIPKPESEWSSPVKPVVRRSWKECNEAIAQKSPGPPDASRSSVCRAASLRLWTKMYVFSRSPKYVCPKMSNKIPVGT